MDQETTHHFKKATDYEAPHHSKGNTISPNDNQNVHYSSLLDEEALEPHHRKTSSHSASHHASVSGDTKARRDSHRDPHRDSHHDPHNLGTGNVSSAIGDKVKSAVHHPSHGVADTADHSTRHSGSGSTGKPQSHSSTHSGSHHVGTDGTAETGRKDYSETPHGREAGSFGEQSKSSAYPHDSRYGPVGGMEETTNPLSSTSQSHHGGQEHVGGFSNKTTSAPSQRSETITGREGRSTSEQSRSPAHDFISGVTSSELTNRQSRSATSNQTGTRGAREFGKPGSSSHTEPEGVKESLNPRGETFSYGGQNEPSAVNSSQSTKYSALHSGVSSLAGATGLPGSSGAHFTSSRPQESFRHGEASEKSDSLSKPSSVSGEHSSRAGVEGVTKSLGSLSTSDKETQSSNLYSSAQFHPHHSSRGLGVSESSARHDPKNPLDVKHHLEKDYETKNPLEGDNKKLNITDNFNNLNSRGI